MIYQKLFLQIAITSLASQNECEIQTLREGLCLLIMVLVLSTEFSAYLERGADTQQNRCKLFQPAALSSDHKYFLAYVYEINSKKFWYFVFSCFFFFFSFLITKYSGWKQILQLKRSYIFKIKHILPYRNKTMHAFLISLSKQGIESYICCGGSDVCFFFFFWNSWMFLQIIFLWLIWKSLPLLW